MYQNCVFCSSPVASRSRGRNEVLLSSSLSHAIERYALNEHGAVGSLYDARTDNILSALLTNKTLLLHKDIKETPACKLIKVDDSNRNNFSKTVDVEDELRLSIALGLTQVRQGTLMLNTYTCSPDRTIRLIDYYHIGQEKCLSTDIQIARNTLSDSLPNNSATHIITSVRKGIDFVIALQLPDSVNHDKIDSVLEKLCKYFIDPTALFLSTKDQQDISCLTPTVFTRNAKIHSLTKNKKLTDICPEIHRCIHQDRTNTPLLYTLHPVKCIYSDISSDERTYSPLLKHSIQKVEEKLLPISNQFRRIEYLLDTKVSKKSYHYFQVPIEKIRENMCHIKKMYTELQRSLATIVTALRQNNAGLHLLTNKLDSPDIKTLASELETLHPAIVELDTKLSFIAQLETKYHMEYLNAADFEDTGDDQAGLERKLVSLIKEKTNCYLCSSDKLIKSNTDEHDKLCQQLMELCKTNSAWHPIFADFSYCSFPLLTMKILQPPSLSLAAQPTTEPNEINILLVGESGVGKSTFINAFVNYLAFHSLNDAEKNQPIVLIPVSFLITIGNDFEEVEIKFGRSDSNENHNRSGQSVTQHCKSYIFSIGNNTKLRIIDTPGVGDTRGAEQDEKNIELIFSYINNLSHLNAVCFLLKPNTSRLHVLFRSCFMELFNFLGPNACENIIFCFTNTRATFFAPGDTGPLLRKMLQEIPDGGNVSFKKENTFCFDSESFRYLAVIKAGYEFSQDEKKKQDFENSWKISVDESVRLLKYIADRPEYHMNKWRSIKHAQMMITLLVRPMLETIRNASRNLVLPDKQDKLCSIEIKVRPLSQPAELCTSHRRNIILVEGICILENSVRQYGTSNECTTCRGLSMKHVPVSYELKYRSGARKGTQFHKETEEMKDRLSHGCFIMTQFLVHIAHISENPFLLWFDLLVRDEEEICSKKSPSIANVKLCNIMVNLKKKYEQDVTENKLDQEYFNLNHVYGCIEEVMTYSIIGEQMNAIKTSQMEMMKNQEYDVSSQYSHMSMNELLRHSTTNQ